MPELPQVLMEGTKYVVFKLAQTAEGKLAKTPYTPGTSDKASATDSRTWRTFLEAQNSITDQNTQTLGIALRADIDGIVGIDIDHCIEADGSLRQGIQAIIDAFHTYTEYSPSRTGLHLLFHASSVELKNDKLSINGIEINRNKFTTLFGGTCAIEVYAHKRFFTLTGNTYPNTPLAVNESPAFARLYQEWRYDNGIVAVALKNKKKLTEAWDGNIAGYGNDASAADIALFGALSRVTKHNEDHIKRIAARSLLYRDKWERDDYLDRTLAAVKATNQESERKPGKLPATAISLPTRILHFMAERLKHTLCVTAQTGAIYEYANGVWKKISADRFRAVVQNHMYLLNELVADTEEAEREILEELIGQLGSITNLGKLANNLKGHIIIDDAQLDADAHLLCATNCVIDLRTGAALAHDPRYYLTHQTAVPYEPSATAPAWETFLVQIQPSESVRGYLQKAIGYTATGETKEQKLFYQWGPGGNGKSTMIRAIAEALGSYAHSGATSLVIEDRFHANALNEDMADAISHRLVFISEGRESFSLSQAKIKMITGGEAVNSRLLYENRTSRVPICKIWFSSNHKQTIPNADYGFERRLVFVPFGQTFRENERDFDLADKLHAELPGILNWIVQGAIAWYADRLRDMPEELKEASREYIQEQSALEEFISSYLIIGEGNSTSAKETYAFYREWALLKGLAQRDILDDKKFRDYMLNEGVRYGFTLNKRSTAHADKVAWEGIATNREALAKLQIALAPTDGINLFRPNGLN